MSWPWVSTTVLYIGLPLWAALDKYGLTGALLVLCAQVLAFVVGVLVSDALRSRKSKEGE